MKNVLFNGTYLSDHDTGIGVVAKNIVNHLPADSFRLLNPVGISRPGSIDVPSNLSHIYGNRGHISRLAWLEKNIFKIMKKEEIDIFFSPLPEAPLIRGVRSLVMAHDLIPLRYPSISFLFLYNILYVQAVLKRAEYVICNSEFTAKDIHQYFNIPSRKLIPIKLGFDNTKYYPLNENRKEYFLILGRHNPHKNISNLLKAFALIKHKEYKLVFAGPSDSRYTPALKKLANDLDIAQYCIWKGWISDYQKLILLNTCSALVIPSLCEGFGLPALEALACGTPVIASNRGALPETVGDAGILIDPLSPKVIANAMLEVINSGDFLKSAQIKGPEHASSFNWQNTAIEIQKLINHM